MACLPNGCADDKAIELSLHYRMLSRRMRRNAWAITGGTTHDGGGGDDDDDEVRRCGD
jgi:hypothetical protein